MCKAELNKSHTCHHKWLTIVKECKEGAGFDGNHLHRFKTARPGLFQPRYASTAANTCPECDKKADYNSKTTRMIVDNRMDRGTLGNGYTLTDGYGNALPVYQASSFYHWSPGYAGGYTTTSCGVTRMARPPQDPGCGCTIM